jgi:hypothetical protein
MRTLAMAFLFCLTSSIANAQSFQMSKAIVCDKTESIMTALKDNYNEKPVWVASGEGTRFSLFTNKETGSWTLLQFTPEYACILGVGKDSNLLLGDSI